MNFFYSLFAVIFLTNLCLHQTEAMKRSAPEDDTDSTTQTTQTLNKGQTSYLRPVEIIINYGCEDNGAMLNELEMLLDAHFFLDISQRPIIMVSPIIMKNFLENLEKKYKERPTNVAYQGHKWLNNPKLYAEKKEGFKTPNGDKHSYDCLNFFEDVLKRVIFFDDPTSHFVFIFPLADRKSLNDHKTCVCETPDELAKLIGKKQDIPPCRNDFETITKFCNSRDEKFKLLVAGHGRTGKKESECYICNLPPQACTTMLGLFDKSNITTVILESCCIGSNNRYYLERKKNNSFFSISAYVQPWQKTKYTFNLVVKGISDNWAVGFHLTENFLNEEISAHASTQEISQALTSKTHKTQAGAIIQVMPAGKDRFEIYENDEIIVIDENTKTEKLQNINAGAIIVRHNTITSPLTVLGYNIYIFCIEPNIHNYTIESITLKDEGIHRFLDSAFTSTAAPEFPKHISIQRLTGKEDFYIDSEENLRWHKRGLQTDITISDVQIHALGLYDVEYSFTLNGKTYSNKKNDVPNSSCIMQ